MAWKRLISPNYGFSVSAGACLVMAQLVFGAPGGPHSATAAADSTQFQHWDRALPRDSSAVVWFSHWGTYQDYRDGVYKYENWGHVVVWEPTAFGGAGGFFSSPRNGYGPGEWFRTIEDIERNFSSTYRFWSEDINGVRVTQYVAPPPPKPKPIERKNKKLLMAYYAHGGGPGKPRWLVFGPGYQLELSTQDAANVFAKQLGITQVFVCGNATPWNKFKRSTGK